MNVVNKVVVQIVHGGDLWLLLKKFFLSHWERIYTVEVSCIFI